MRAKALRIIALGNPLAGDDGVGPRVAERLAGRALPEGVSIEPVAAPGPEMIDWLSGDAEVWFVDALRDPDHAAGDIVEVTLTPGSDKLAPSAGQLVSSHGFTLANLLELGRTMDRWHVPVRLWAITGERFEAGAGLSPAVEDAVEALVRRLYEEVLGKAA